LPFDDLSKVLFIATATGWILPAAAGPHGIIEFARYTGEKTAHRAQVPDPPKQHAENHKSGGQIEFTPMGLRKSSTLHAERGVRTLER